MLNKLYAYANIFGPRTINAEAAYDCLLHLGDEVESLDIEMCNNIYIWSGHSEQFIIDYKKTDFSTEQLQQIIQASLYQNAISTVLHLVEQQQHKSQKTHELKDALTLWQSTNAQVLRICEIAKRMDLTAFYQINSQSQEYAWYLPSCSFAGNLALDMGDTYSSNTFNLPIFVNGNIEVDGDITNFCCDTGSSLLVKGNIFAKNIIAGGARIEASGNIAVDQVFIGHYEGGWVQAEKINGRLLWNNRHTIEAKIHFDHYVNDFKPNSETINTYIVNSLRETIEATRYKKNKAEIKAIKKDRKLSKEEKQQALASAIAINVEDILESLVKATTLDEIFILPIE